MVDRLLSMSIVNPGIEHEAGLREIESDAAAQGLTVSVTSQRLDGANIDDDERHQRAARIRSELVLFIGRNGSLKHTDDALITDLSLILAGMDT